MNATWFEGARIFVLFVLPCTIAAAMLAVLLGVLGRMKRLEIRLASSEENLKTECGTLARGLNTLEKEVAAASDERAHEPPAGTAQNSAKRAKALKMHRLGQSIEQISTALRLPRGDVVMLLKVHGIVLRSLEPQEKTLNESSD